MLKYSCLVALVSDGFKIVDFRFLKRLKAQYKPSIRPYSRAMHYRIEAIEKLEQRIHDPKDQRKME